MRDLFEYINYREYLNEALPRKGRERGARAKLALHLSCQNGFISLVISGKSDFSPEHAIQVSEFLHHTQEETEYFLLLVQYARAGSKKLEDHLYEKIKTIQNKRSEIKSHISHKTTLTNEHQLFYYSSWHATAIHMCLMIPELQNKKAIAEHLNLSPETVTQGLDFLIQVGLAKKEKEAYTATPTRIHLPSDSPLISKHHTNWRLQAIQSLDKKRKTDLHYSLIMSLSDSALEKIRNLILKMIQESEPILKEAKDETTAALTIDLFKL